MEKGKLSYRTDVRYADRELVHKIASSSGFFSPVEIDIAVELVDEHLSKGKESEYFFLFADRDGRAVGYTCFGPIAGSTHSYDLYWIAVHNRFRRCGIGKGLLARSEELILQQGGRHIYIDTSSRPQYEPTRSFYSAQGYREGAFLEDFYAPGDGKIIYVKTI
jgi:ribosomal protein S18 acetylase RimI-like enzyme